MVDGMEDRRKDHKDGKRFLRVFDRNILDRKIRGRLGGFGDQMLGTTKWAMGAPFPWE